MDQNMYDLVKKKYGLPDFYNLDLEFEISLIEEENWVLRNICKKMHEKIEMLVDIVEHVLQPDPNCYSDLYECKIFRGSEKDALFVLFKELMHAHRACMELDLLEDEKSCAEFIKQFFSDWQNLKKSLIPFVEKLKSSWKESPQDKEKLDYLG